MRVMRSFSLLVILCLALTGCQEISVVVEMPTIVVQAVQPSIAGQGTAGAQTPQPAEPTAEPTRLPAATLLPSSTLTATGAVSATPQPSFDPSLYFFPEDSLPQDLIFVADDKKTFLVSYLNSPGSLFGIAHVREYDCYPADLHVIQTLIQSPIEVSSEMLRTGHNGDRYVAVPEDILLGEEAMIFRCPPENSEDCVSYRFYQNNIMVVVDLWGSNAFINDEDVYTLAKTIHDRLPESFPIPTTIESPSLELEPGLAETYFRELYLVDCYPPYAALDPVYETDLGYCFQADILELIHNLKVGIYDTRYGKLVYMKEFLFVPPMGEWRTGLFYPVWGYAWQHFHEGEYEALFWVDDHLAAVLPYHLAPQEK